MTKPKRMADFRTGARPLSPRERRRAADVARRGKRPSAREQRRRLALQRALERAEAKFRSAF